MLHILPTGSNFICKTAPTFHFARTWQDTSMVEGDLAPPLERYGVAILNLGDLPNENQ